MDVRGGGGRVFGRKMDVEVREVDEEYLGLE